MAYEFTKLGSVEVLDSVPADARTLVEVNGEIKRAPNSTGTGLPFSTEASAGQVLTIGKNGTVVWTGDEVVLDEQADIIADTSVVFTAVTEGSLYAAEGDAGGHIGNGHTYTVVFDGETYTLTAEELDGNPVLGNASILGGEATTEEPFAIQTENDKYTVSVADTEATEHTFSVVGPNVVIAASVYDEHLAKKQDTLTFDTKPISKSENPVTSGGIYSAMVGLEDNMGRVFYAFSQGSLQWDGETRDREYVTVFSNGGVEARYVRMTDEVPEIISFAVSAGVEEIPAWLAVYMGAEDVVSSGGKCTMNIGEDGLSYSTPEEFVWIVPTDDYSVTIGNMGTFTMNKGVWFLCYIESANLEDPEVSVSFPYMYISAFRIMGHSFVDDASSGSAASAEGVEFG